MEIKNNYEIITIDNVEFVEFATNGKNKHVIIVDKDIWFKYLSQYNWTAKSNYNKIYAKTSINGVSKELHRFIAENEFSELEIFNRSIDHKDGNTLDNRLSNLRHGSQVMNMNNLMSKAKEKNIYKQNNGTFKVSMNICGKLYFKTFKTVDECIVYRDEVLIPLKEKELQSLIKKERDIEFERGLHEKLKHGELEEIKDILKKYGLDLI